MTPSRGFTTMAAASAVVTAAYYIIIIIIVVFITGFSVVVIPIDATTTTTESLSSSSPRQDIVTTTNPNSLPGQIVRAKIPQLLSHSSSLSSSSSSTSEEQQSQYPQPQHSQYPQQQQLWMYRGKLFDPMDGRAIATIQGLELIRPVYDTTGLAIHKVLQPRNKNNNSNSDTDSITLWSQKIFCYTTTNENEKLSSRRRRKGRSPPPRSSSTKIPTTPTIRLPSTLDNDHEDVDNEEVLLRSVRIRPQSPRKILPLDQVVSVYETATTYIEVRDDDDTDGDEGDNRPRNPASGGGRGKFIVHSEWPNGQTVWNTASVVPTTTVMDNNSGIPTNIDVSNNINVDSVSQQLDFTVYARLRSRSNPNAINPPRKMIHPSFDDNNDNNKHLKKKKKRNKNGEDVVISPKRSTLVQFGSSPSMDENNKFGARETYSYRNIAPPPPLSLLPTSSTTQRNGNIPINNKLFGRFWKKNRRPPPQNVKPHSTAPTTVSYSRYGEGPPWFAPGRQCLLELQGRPIQSIDDATPVLKQLVCSGSSSCDIADDSSSSSPVSGFGSSGNTAIQQAWNRSRSYFHRRTSKSTTNVVPATTTTLLQLNPSMMMEYNSGPDPRHGKVRQRLSMMIQTVQRGSVTVWERIRDATEILN